jgi:hypothetical protein
VRDTTELRDTYATAAAQAIPPIVAELLADGDVDPRLLPALSEALTRAFAAGVNAGETEVLAQAIEQGVGVTVTAPRAA